MSNELQTGISRRLKQEMKRRGLSQNQMAQQTGVPQPTVNGQFRRKSFSVEFLAGAAKVLGVNPGWLMTGQGDRRPVKGSEEAERLRVAGEIVDEMVKLVDRYRAGIGATSPASDAAEPEPGEAIEDLQLQDGQDQAASG